MRLKIAGLVVFILAGSIVWALFSKNNDSAVHKSADIIENRAPQNVTYGNSVSAGANVTSLSVAAGVEKADSGENVPPISEEEKAYNRMEALEIREAKMKGRTAYIQARIAWRRELNEAMAAARVSGDKSDVLRVMAEEPDKKSYLQGG